MHRHVPVITAHCLLAAVLWGGAPSVASAAGPFDCKQHQCGLPGDGSYTKIVVGKLTAVATHAQALDILEAARKQGWWSAIPENNDDEYFNSVQVVSIKSTAPYPVTVMMTPQEFALAPLKPGDLVRYTPHRVGHEKPEYNGPHAAQYYALTGCVAVLCSASDKACSRRYRPGIYRRSDGAEIGLNGDDPLPHGSRIDPDTILPVSRSASAEKINN